MVFVYAKLCKIGFSTEETGELKTTMNVHMFQDTDGSDDKRLLPSAEHALVFCSQMISAYDGSRIDEFDWNARIVWAKQRLADFGVPSMPGVLPSELGIPAYVGDILKLVQFFTRKDFSQYKLLQPDGKDALFIGRDV
jgi:hypothetical protein